MLKVKLYMSEKYKPTQDEITEAEDTMKELGLKERNQEAQDALEAGIQRGREQGRKEMLRMSPDEFKKEKDKLEIIEQHDFSKKTKQLILDGAFGIDGSYICPQYQIDEDSFLEFFEKVDVRDIDICDTPNIAREDVFRKLYAKNPFLMVRGKKEIKERLKVIFKNDKDIMENITYRFSIHG